MRTDWLYLWQHRSTDPTPSPSKMFLYLVCFLGLSIGFNFKNLKEMGICQFGRIHTASPALPGKCLHCHPRFWFQVERTRATSPCSICPSWTALWRRRHSCRSASLVTWPKSESRLQTIPGSHFLGLFWPKAGFSGTLYLIFWEFYFHFGLFKYAQRQTALCVTRNLVKILGFWRVREKLR